MKIDQWILFQHNNLFVLYMPSKQPMTTSKHSMATRSSIINKPGNKTGNKGTTRYVSKKNTNKKKIESLQNEIDVFSPEGGIDEVGIISLKIDDRKLMNDSQEENIVGEGPKEVIDEVGIKGLEVDLPQEDIKVGDSKLMDVSPEDQIEKYIKLPNVEGRDIGYLQDIPPIFQYIFSQRVQNAFLHFIHLHSPSKALLIEYKGDTDPDDWRVFLQSIFNQQGSFPLHYKTINFFYYLNWKKLPTTTTIRKEHPLIYRQTASVWTGQLERCIDLIFLLNDYPISTMEENVIVYRGQKDYSFYDGMVEGTTFVQPSFFSTTLNIDTARNFAGGSEILLRILVPNNVPLPFISERLTPLSNSTGGNESEILFPPSTEFRFIDFTIENGIKMINLQLLKFSDVPTEQHERELFRHEYMENLTDQIKKLEELYYREFTPSSTQSTTPPSSQSYSPYTSYQSSPRSPRSPRKGGSIKKTKKSKRNIRRKTKKYKNKNKKI